MEFPNQLSYLGGRILYGWLVNYDKIDKEPTEFRVHVAQDVLLL